MNKLTRIRRLVALSVVAGVAVIGLAGCQKSPGSTAPPPISGAEVAERINKELPPQLQGVDAGDAKCPDKVQPDTEEPSGCELDVEGQKVAVLVTREEENSKDYTVSLGQAVIVLSALETHLESDLKDKDVVAAVSCGNATIRVMDANEQMSCRMSGSRNGVLDVTILSLDGKYSFTERDK